MASRKGISPLIASVLLIAFTISVAMLFSPFATNTIKDIQSGTSQRTVDIQKSSQLGLEMKSASFNRSNDHLSVVVQNTGEPINDSNISISVLGDSITENQQYNVDLSSRELTTLKLPVEKTYPLKTVQTSLTDYPISDESEIKCTPTKGLVGYWTFNNEQTKNGWAKDISGQGNNGSLEGGVSRGVEGQVGEAYSFDGNDDYVNIQDNPSLNPDAISITLWLNNPSYETNEGILTKGDGSTSQRQYWLFTKSNNDGQLNTEFHNESGENFDLDLTGYSNSKWNHIGYTYNPDTGTFTGFLDGSRKGSMNIEGPLVSTSTNLHLGHMRDNNDFLSGEMSDIRIYNRSLSQDEIQRLYEVRSKDWGVNSCKLVK